MQRRSTVDQIPSMRQILEDCWEQNTEVYHSFMDLQAAYDTVWRKELLCKMHKLRFPSNNKLCRILNNEINVRLKFVSIYTQNLK